MQNGWLLIGLVLGIYIASSIHSILSFFFPSHGLGEKQGLIAAGAGVLILAIALVFRTVSAGQFVIANPFDVVALYSLVVTAAYLVITLRHQTRSLSILIFPYVTAILAVGATRSGGGAALDPRVQSGWLNAHILTALTGYGLFTFACILAVAYLVQDRNLKHKNLGLVFRQLPSLETLDRLMHGQILPAFIIFSVSIGLGIFLTHLNRWGAGWITDPKIVATVLTWAFYAVLLYLQRSAGEHGKKVAIITILGFVCILITFFGINMLATGMHRVTFTGPMGGRE